MHDKGGALKAELMLGELILVEPQALVIHEPWCCETMIDLGDYFLNVRRTSRSMFVDEHAVAFVSAVHVHEKVRYFEVLLTNGKTAAIFDDRRFGFWLQLDADVHKRSNARNAFMKMVSIAGWERVFLRSW